jgi:hypothetical protein
MDFRVNSHIHLPPNFSAFASVRQAVALAAAQGVRVVGVTNYYDYSVYRDFAALAAAAGIYTLYGLETICLLADLVQTGVKINDPGNPGKMYLCGKGPMRLDPMSPRAAELLATIRRNDGQRMARMAQRLAAHFAARGIDTGLDDAAIRRRLVQRYGCPPETVHLQERHLCQAFQEVLFDTVPPAARADALRAVLGAPASAPDKAVAVQSDLRTHLLKAGKPAFVEETFLSFPQAREFILELGAIPCYPVLADGTRPICPYEEPVEELIRRLREGGIAMAELIPIRNSPDVLTRYVTALRAAGFPVVGGTEHNTLDLLPLDPTCAGGAPLPPEVRRIFREGACVVAAHQSLTARGEPGFVDAQGRPHPAYATDETRIAAFARRGEAVIEKFLSRSRACGSPA